jgi:AcrR family transcriptional regulator
MNHEKNPELKAKRLQPKRRASRASQNEFRRELEAIAERLFNEEGYENVSIRRITREAGCSPMTFYIYFESKRDVLRSIWDRIAQDAIESCLRAIETIEDPVARLKGCCAAHIAFWLAHPDDYLAIFLFPPGRVSPDDSYYRVRPESYAGITMFSDLFSACLVDGRTSPHDAATMGEALFGGTIGVVHLLLTLPEYPWRRDTLPDAIVTTMIDGAFR